MGVQDCVTPCTTSEYGKSNDYTHALISEQQFLATYCDPDSFHSNCDIFKNVALQIR